MKRFSIVIFSLLIIFSCSAVTSSYEEETKRIAFLFDGKSESLEHSSDLIKEEILKLTEDIYTIKFVENQYGEYDPVVIQKKLKSLLADD